MSKQLEIGEPVKHVKRKLNEARFAGYTKTGRAKVTHNASFPFGVCFYTDTFKAENIVSRRK